MTRQEIIKNLTVIAERLCWAVDVYEQPTKEKTISFSWDTSHGQDFFFTVDIEEKDTLEEVFNKIKDYVENYDPDEEATYWIGDDGHGINGAPYHIKNIVEDMEEVQYMLKELLLEITNTLIK